MVAALLPIFADRFRGFPRLVVEKPAPLWQVILVIAAMLCVHLTWRWWKGSR